MAILPGGIPSAETHGSSKAKGVIRSWKPTNWRLEEAQEPRPIISPDAIDTAEAFGNVQFAYKIKGAGDIASLAAFGDLTLYEAGMYDWLLVDYADRLIDWSGAGVWYNASTPSQPWLGTKGIPTYTVGITVNTVDPGHAYYCDPTGVVDCSAKLQAAINACPTGQAVYMPAGTYRKDLTVYIPSHKAVRGAGAWLTTIKSYSEWGFTMNGGGYNETNYDIASGYTIGSYTLTMSGSHPFTVGSVATIDQLNAGDIVSESCSWCGHGGLRSLRQGRIVTAVDGLTLTFNKPLYWTYEAGNSPQLCRDVTSTVINAGVENLTIEVNGGSTSGGVWAYGNLYSWMKGVRITNTQAFAFNTHTACIGFEIRRCYIDHPQTFTTSHGYGIHFLYGAYDCLVEDNIFKHNHIHMSFEAGSAGNVVGYNYMETTYEASDPTWYQCSIMFYGAHCYKNLLEGNYLGKTNPSDAFGSSSHNTYFRNRLTRQNPGVSVSSVVACAIVDELAYYYSFVGNILGYAGMTGDYEINPIPSLSNVLVWKRGYHSNATGAPTDAKVASTMLREGNYCYLDDLTRWTAGAKSVPMSLYYAAKPSWFGAEPWPPIGPDVGGYSLDIPAKTRWDAYVLSADLEDLF